MKMVYKLRIIDYLAFLAIVAVGYAFAVTQRYYLPELIRPFTLLLAVILLMTAFFFWVKPLSATALARWLSILLTSVVLVLIVIQHVVITYDVPGVWGKLAIIMGISVLSPFIAGAIYAVWKNRKKHLLR